MAQVLPFAVLVLMLFAFALDPDRGVLERATPGLFWVAVLFSSVLTLQRSFGVEAEDGVLDALRLSGMSPAGIYLGKVGGARRCSCWCSRRCWRSASPCSTATVFRGVGLLVVTVVLATDRHRGRRGRCTERWPHGCGAGTRYCRC